MIRSIIRLALERGAEGLDGCTIVDDISHDLLGRMSGTTRQSVGRALNDLVEQNYVRIEYSKLVILDIQGMISKYKYLLSSEFSTSLNIDEIKKIK